jgi:preprotein translocase subunit SecA
MYSKLSGMTGTALTEEDEFKQIYALDVVEVPTNKPMIRIDQNDAVFRTYNGKINAIVAQIKACHEKGQPVLVGTVSIDKSEELSKVLKRVGVPHTVLNAKHHEKEAEIVAQAGRLGAVTISTNMAGRGTDIMLGGNPEYMAKNEMRKAGYEEGLIAMATSSAPSEDEAVNEARAAFKTLYDKHREEIAPEAEAVRQAGGLFILGTERHESRRIDNQLRGRSGRQGDPGESRFFLSLEDDLMRLFGSDRVSGICERLGLDENTPIDAKILSGSIESAQKKIEDNNFNRRKNVLTYDDVMNQQRNIIYQQRSEVLHNDNVSEKIVSMIKDSVNETFEFCFGVDTPEDWKFDEFKNHYLGLVTDKKNFVYTEEELHSLDKEELREELLAKAMEIYESKTALFASMPGMSVDTMREVEKVILLQNVDKKWMDHLEDMDELKEYIGLNSYAQRDPVAMYRIQGSEMFEQMVDDIKEDTVRQILSVMPRPKATERVQVAKPTSEGFGGDKPIVRRPVVKAVRVGRNDPCPCGSGKKYKKCCGQNETADKD